MAYTPLTMSKLLFLVLVFAAILHPAIASEADENAKKATEQRIQDLGKLTKLQLRGYLGPDDELELVTLGLKLEPLETIAHAVKQNLKRYADYEHFEQIFPRPDSMDPADQLLGNAIVKIGGAEAFLRDLLPPQYADLGNNGMVQSAADRFDRRHLEQAQDDMRINARTTPEIQVFGEEMRKGGVDFAVSIIIQDQAWPIYHSRNGTKEHKNPIFCATRMCLRKWIIAQGNELEIFEKLPEDLKSKPMIRVFGDPFGMAEEFFKAHPRKPRAKSQDPFEAALGWWFLDPSHRKQLVTNGSDQLKKILSQKLRVLPNGRFGPTGGCRSKLFEIAKTQIAKP